MSKKTYKLSSQSFDAWKRTNQCQGSRFDLLHKLESDSCANRPANNDNIFLSKTKFVDNIIIDNLAISFDNFRLSFSFI